eukprot:COSAG01_NODE_4408_length_5059_cov_2.693565_6_plen_87_part_00
MSRYAGKGDAELAHAADERSVIIFRELRAVGAAWLAACLAVSPRDTTHMVVGRLLLAPDRSLVIAMIDCVIDAASVRQSVAEAVLS